MVGGPTFSKPNLVWVQKPSKINNKQNNTLGKSYSSLSDEQIPQRTLALVWKLLSIIQDFKLRFQAAFQFPPWNQDPCTGQWNSLCIKWAAHECGDMAGWGWVWRWEGFAHLWAVGSVGGLGWMVLLQWEPAVPHTWRVASQKDLCRVWAYAPALSHSR